MLRIFSRGDQEKTSKYLRKLLVTIDNFNLEPYGQAGVNALMAATPRESGKAASSWYYEVAPGKTGPQLIFKNDNIENGFKVVIGIQYGHGTGTGGWVDGIDFINPALRPVFERIADDIEKAVNSV